MIRRERPSATVEGSPVVFLIGMRVNKPWKVHRWWPVARAMPRMLADLQARPELGMLGGEMWFGSNGKYPSGGCSAALRSCIEVTCSSGFSVTP